MSPSSLTFHLVTSALRKAAWPGPHTSWGECQVIKSGIKINVYTCRGMSMGRGLFLVGLQGVKKQWSTYTTNQ